MNDRLDTDDLDFVIDTEDVPDNPPESADVIQQYLQDIRSRRSLSAIEESALFQQIETGNENAKNELIAGSLPMVVHIAKKYQNRGLPLSDLISEGSLGLISALKKFDPQKEVRFFTYAAHWVRYYIRKAVIESRQVHLPMYIIRSISTCLRAQKHGKTDIETATELNMSIADVQRLLSLSHSIKSLDLEDSPDLPDTHATEPIDQILLDERNRIVKNTMSLLTARQRFVLRKRFGFDGEDPMSLDEIGGLMDLSRESIRLIQNDAMNVFRRHYHAG